MATNFNVNLGNSQDNFNIDLNDQVESFVVEFGETTWITDGDFNKLKNRPSYNGVEMTGDTNIPVSPTLTSQLTNDSNYQNANDVSSAISTHNQSSSAHQDIRQLVSDEATTRFNADNGLQGQIDAITSASDVVDIVGTYAELEAYDTQHLKDNDVIKVLQDEMHNDAMTYWRWSTHTNTWTYIGAEGPYYTKSETNTLLDGKLDADEVPDGFFDGPATISPTASTSVEIDGGLKLKSLKLLGNTTQESSPAPTPSDPQEINVVTRTQNIVLAGETPSDTQNYNIALGGANLLDLRDGAYSASGVDAVVANGVVTLNGQATANSFISIPVNSNYSINNGDKFVLSLNNATANSSCSLRVNSGGQYDVNGSQANNNKTSILDPTLPLLSSSITIRTQSGGSYTDYVIKPQLSRGTTVLPYGSFVPVDIELCKLDEYQDYIYKSGSNWYVHKEIGKIVYDGSGTWTYQSQYHRCYINKPADMKSGSNDYLTTTKCSHFTGGNTSGDGDNLYYVGGTTVSFKSIAIITSQSAWTTWLAAHNVVLYYALTTPTDTQIVDEGLINQLEAVLEATLYPQTTMTVTGYLAASLGLEVYTEHLNSLLEIAAQPAPSGGGGGSSVTVAQTTGTSQDDVMSQDATTKMLFPDIANSGSNKILIGPNASIASARAIVVNGKINNAISQDCIAISTDSSSPAQIGTNGRATKSIAIGDASTITRGDDSLAIGCNSYINYSANHGYNVALGANSAINGYKDSVALGTYANVTRDGEVNVGTGSNGSGFSSSNYRVIGGVYDGQTDHDAATVGQINATIDAINTALSISIPHIGA